MTTIWKEGAALDNYCNEKKGGSASAVEHPAHYTAGDVECIDAIRLGRNDGIPGLERMSRPLTAGWFVREPARRVSEKEES